MWKIYSSGLPLLVAALIAVNADIFDDFDKSIYNFEIAAEGNISESLQENQNFVFSSVAIQSAAALAFLGAAGRTEADMVSGLFLPTADKRIVATIFGLVLKTFKEFSMVTSDQKMYIKEGVSCSSQFQELAERKLGTAVEHIDFANKREAAKKMNNWVNIKTQGKITEIVDENSMGEDTSSIILNFLYLKGIWDRKFSKQLTSKGEFWTSESDSVQVEYMSSTARYEVAFLREVNAMAVKLPFHDSNLAMILIVPNERTGLKDVWEADSDINLWSFRKMKANVVMPKFKAEMEIKLSDIFKKMGMSSMFRGANFSKMGPNLKVSEIIHKAVLEVDEEGSKFPTVIGMGSFEVQVVADHPFGYLIVESEEESEIIHFVGRFVKP